MPRRLPDWLRKSLAPGQEAARTDALLKELGLHTICESGRCPNRDECYSQKTATFMVMGDVCTRSCRFCSVKTGRPQPLDAREPRRVALAVERLGLEHVVVTSVDRDDLPDEGMRHFASVVTELKKFSDSLIVEVLTPDFRRTKEAAVRLLVDAGTDIFNHNVETVPRLYRKVQPQCDYARSLDLLREVKRFSKSVLTKSGLMVGLGESEEEIFGVMRDLRAVDCDMLTIGQYLRSDPRGLEVEAFVEPAVFARFKEEGLRMGFLWVESGPFVRSSFHAKDSFEALKIHLRNKRRGAALAVTGV